jgi:opacity protein-like surface antigen
MRRFLFVNILLLLVFYPLVAGPGSPKFKLKNNSQDLKFMVGLKGGLTFTQPVVLQKYNIISSLDDATAQSGIKSYKAFWHNIGYQYAFTALYQFNQSVDIRMEPTFSTYLYKYNAAYSWVSTGANNERIDMAVDHRQTLKYVEIPITLRYLYGSGKAKPFVQGGIFYGFMLNAIKTSDRTETYTNDAGTSTLNSDTETGDASGSYTKSRYGFNAGIGVDYDLSAIRLTFDVNLNFGINRVTNQASRYSTQQFSGGLYDAQDDVRLLIPSVNIGILFPLRKPARSAMKCSI